MRYLTINNGSVSIHTDDSMPEGAIPLTDAEYDQLASGEYTYVNNAIIPYIKPAPTPAEVASNNYKGVIRRRAAKLTPIEAVLLLKTIGE